MRGAVVGGVVVALVVAVVGLVAPVRAAVAAATPGGCDPLVGGECLLPFPNDWYTRADAHSDTGRRVAFRPGVLPADALGVPVDPTAWNRSDGFSPGSTLTVRVPGVDLAASRVAPVTDIGASLRADAAIVLLDTDTGTRWPYWAELDARATRADRQALLIHPARNLADGHHYAVALRGLVDTGGARIPPPAPFAAVAGARLHPHDPLYARQRELAPTLRTLARAGVGTAGLYLAWDFTVASSRNLTGDMTTIRDDAFRRLGDRAPEYTIGAVTDFDAATNPRIAREVTGTVSVPSYLSLPGGPSGSVFARDARGRPVHLPGNTQLARFRCEIPRAAFSTPSRPALYGHGLLGSRDEVGAGNVQAMAAEHDITFCATDWIGMAADDVLTVVGALTDANHFAAIPERSQQGILDALFLGRDLVHRKGFATSSAFRTADGRPLLDPRAALAYDGNSQGGILGGALVAVSPDIRRGVLGVTGMNYSLLLDRSADFAQFQPVLDASYPDKLRQQLVFDLLQMLWDRGETDGYAAHLTDHHQVLMHLAYGDHQVANVASEVEARTIGARLVTPALAAGRSPDLVPYWGIRPAGTLPYRGSAMVVWDSGTPSPPTTNTAPDGSGYGHDPHSDPRNSAAARQQKATFLATGTVVDVCGGAPCTANPA
ncbi:hypothetical protein [Actinocatenispora rupis]|uniref:hypothetical protein n=1 Tax=Actinocatenispora rupis TaxID=519421 RepID=UPI001EF3D4EC|nr:hypothetical protein [Actinocatenispora rupis]